MTYPGEQPPTVPGPPNQYWPPQPQPAAPAYGPPPGYAPGPPIKPPNPKLVFWTSLPGIISLLAIMVGVVVVLSVASDLISGPAAKKFDITVTSCKATTGSLSTATVGFTVKNVSDQARGATVKIEYRDGSGARLDTDTVRVPSLRPGGTARYDESTILDGEASGEIDCSVTVDR